MLVIFYLHHDIYSVFIHTCIFMQLQIILLDIIILCLLYYIILYYINLL